MYIWDRHLECQLCSSSTNHVCVTWQWFNERLGIEDLLLQILSSNSWSSQLRSTIPTEFSCNCSEPGPCLTTATWRCCKNLSQWERSFHWKLRCHWLEFLRQCQIAVVRQGPELSTQICLGMPAPLYCTLTSNLQIANLIMGSYLYQLMVLLSTYHGALWQG